MGERGRVGDTWGRGGEEAYAGEEEEGRKEVVQKAIQVMAHSRRL